MQIVHHARDFAAPTRKVCLAIGMFDGIHLGHQQVIRQTISDARQHAAAAVVVTFDRHPNSIVAPERVPPLIYPLSQKLAVIESMGVDALLLLRFDLELSQVPADEFIRGLARDFGYIHSICVGSAFTFGRRRAGNVALLRALGQELKFIVHGLAAVSLDGKIVSSTRIREAIRTGNLDAAGQMLGRPYSIVGPVIPGDQLGGKLGYPTANIDVSGLVLPPLGVYAAQVAWKGHSYPAVANIGFRPTIQAPTPAPRLEVHLLDFNHNLYGETLELTFVEKIRDEQKFPSVDALRDQIARDIEAARHLLED